MRLKYKITFFCSGHSPPGFYQWLTSVMAITKSSNVTFIKKVYIIHFVFAEIIIPFIPPSLKQYISLEYRLQDPNARGHTKATKILKIFELTRLSV